MVKRQSNGGKNKSHFFEMKSGSEIILFLLLRPGEIFTYCGMEGVFLRDEQYQCKHYGLTIVINGAKRKDKLTPHP